MATIFALLERLAWVLLGTILGAAVRFFMKGTYYDTDLYKRSQMRREYEAVMAAMRESRDSFVMGGYQIQEMAVLPFLHGLRREDIRSKMLPQAQRLPQAIEELEYTYLNQRVAQLRASGRTVDFNDTYSLRGISIRRPQELSDRWRDRRNTIEFSFEPSNFKSNLMVNEALDQNLMNVGGQVTSLRAFLGLNSFDWSKLPDLPLHMWFSTVVSVVTSDNMFVIALRSGFQMIGSGAPNQSVMRASVSAAEGMLRPTDSDTEPPNEFPSPFKTAERALWRELGLVAGEHYILRDLSMIAMCFDTKRYQPLAVFYVEVPVSFQEVKECWSMAPDNHENAALLPVPMTPPDVAQLLTGTRTYEDKCVELFSNHQKVGALLAACKRFGIRTMSRTLRGSMAVA